MLWAPKWSFQRSIISQGWKNKNQRALCRSTGLGWDQPLWRWSGKCHLADGILMLTSGACSYQKKPTWETAGECALASVGYCSNLVGLGVEVLNPTQSCQPCQCCGSSSRFFLVDNNRGRVITGSINKIMEFLFLGLTVELAVWGILLEDLVLLSAILHAFGFPCLVQFLLVHKG